MSQWIRKSPLPAIQLALLILSAYFLVYRPTILTAALFILLHIRLFQQYGKKSALKVLPVLMVFLALFSGHALKMKWEEERIVLTYVDENGGYHEEKVISEVGDYSRVYQALHDSIIHGADKLIQDQETILQMEILEEGIRQMKEK